MVDDTGETGAFFSEAAGGTALEQYRTLVNTIDDGLYKLDADGRFVAVNDEIATVTGYSREELLGSHVSKVLDEVDVARVEAAIRALLETEPDTVTVELPVKTASGDVIPCELRVSILQADGEFRGSVGVVRDVSDRTAEDVATVGARYESLVNDVLDEADVGVFVLDEAFDVAWINAAIERYFGLDRADVLGRDKREVVRDDLRDVVANHDEFADDVLATYDDNTDAEEFECRVTPGDGRDERWLEHRSRPIESGQYADGRVELYYDVTDQKETQRSLEESEQRFRSLVDAVEEYAIFMLDPDGRVVSWNEGASRLKGYGREEILGEHFSTFYTDDDVAEGVPGRNLSTAAAGGSAEDEGWRVRKDGSRFWANVSITAVRDDGDLLGYAKVTRDMTERRRSEAEHELLYETTRSIAEAETVEDGLAAALRDVCEVTDWVYAEAWLPTDDGALRRSSVSPHEDDLADFAAFSEGYTLAPGEGLPGRVLASGEYEWATALPDGTRAESPRLSEALEVGLGSSLGVPVVADGEVVAVLTFHMRETREPDDWLAALVSSVAVELGELLVRREAEEELARERELTEQILETAPVGIAVFDPDGAVVRANHRITDVFERPADDALADTDGDRTLLDEDGEPLAHDDLPFRRVVETGEAVFNRELQVPRSNGSPRWVSVNAMPITDDDGGLVHVVATATDVTRLKEQAAQLERRREELEAELDDVFARIDDAFYALDDQWRFTYVNDRAEVVLDRPEGELLGTSIWEAFPGTVDSGFEREYRRAMETQEPVSFEEFYTPLERWYEVRAYPSESGLSVYFTDVTERERRERELEEYRRWNRTLVENYPSGAVALVDEEFRYVTFGGTPEGVTDVTRADLEGSPVREALPEKIADVVVPGYEAALDGEPSEFEATVDDRIYQFHFVPVRDDDGDVFAATAMSQDVTEREERERELRDAKLQLEAATEAGAVGTWEWQIPEDRFVAGPSFAKTFGVDPDEAREGVSLERFLSGIHEDDRDRVGRSVEEAVESCTEYEEEYRVWDADGELRWVVARGRVECGEDGDPVTFPGALTDITDRKRAEMELERSRQQLLAMNNLNGVVRDITDAVIEQSTREEIEQVVCAALAASDSYEFAWIGDVDPSTQTVRPRTESGVEGSLDGVSISVDSDDERGEGPTGRAVRTREVQTSRDVDADDHHDPRREQSEENGVRSSASVPIVHEGTLYGVLNVYAERPTAFSDEEREVMGHLGELVGHAIAAVERKRALTSDQVLELDFHVDDVFGEFDLPVAADDRITLDEAVPAGDDEYLVYGTATEDDVAAIEAMVDALPHWESVRLVGSDVDRTRFELHLSEPPVLSAAATRGGYVEGAYIEDGDFNMTIQLPPSVESRQLVEAIKTAYPTAEMRAQRQVSRGDDGSDRVTSTFVEGLTDRQRVVLESAYFAGYFEWPRESSGEEIADSLGISPATFSQHLRTAENKVFGGLLAAAQT